MKSRSCWEIAAFAAALTSVAACTTTVANVPISSGEIQTRIVKTSTGTMTGGACPAGQMSVAVPGEAWLQSSGPIGLASVDRCVVVTGTVKAKPHDLVDLALDANGRLYVTGNFHFTHRVFTRGLFAPGRCKEGFTMVTMDFRQDQTQSIFADYIVAPPPTTRCLPVNKSIVARSGTAVLSRDEDGVFGVVGIR